MKKKNVPLVQKKIFVQAAMMVIYYLTGKCFLDYSFRATYFTEKDNQTISLIGLGHLYIYKIIKMKIGEEVLMNPPSNYKFPFAGNHTVDILIDLSLITSFSNYFNSVTNLISISFYPSFYNESIKEMDGFFLDVYHWFLLI